MSPFDEAVIRAAETQVDKWRAFEEDSNAEDPDIYTEALEKAVDARREALKATTSWVMPAGAIKAGAVTIEKEDPPTTVADLTTPSITVGTQVRLTGVVTRVGNTEKYVSVVLNGDAYSGSLNVAVESLEVIRQPFKRGEVVWNKAADSDDHPCVVAKDETDGLCLLGEQRESARLMLVRADLYERRPSRAEGGEMRW